MAMSQQLLPPVNRVYGFVHRRCTEGDGMRLNAFGHHDDADIGFDPLSANRRFVGHRRLGGVRNVGFCGADTGL